ncbi:MAG: retroviral-like aspartic protease family protein [Candidatus Aureabacteria bacterium]|nr:retroviral-like aspartic protease family protein [Candidatus Auribacterota bacterium]
MKRGPKKGFSVIFKPAVLLFIFISLSFFLSAEKEKCSSCGFLNEKEDRYCLQCGKEVRPPSKEELKNQELALKSKVDDYVENARKYYHHLIYYGDDSKTDMEQALYHSRQAITFGGTCLTKIVMAEMEAIAAEMEERLSRLRSALKSSSKKIRLTQIGKSLFVDVSINKKIKIPFLLDTGCSHMLISPSLAQTLHLPLRRERYHVHLANGQTVWARKTFFDSVDVGGNVVNNIPGFVLETAFGNNPGLLGMAFFEHFIFKIDFEKKELFLEPKK